MTSMSKGSQAAAPPSIKDHVPWPITAVKRTLFMIIFSPVSDSRSYRWCGRLHFGCSTSSLKYGHAKGHGHATAVILAGIQRVHFRKLRFFAQ